MRIKRIINKPVEISGIGLHTGVKARIIIDSAVSGQGIKFIRQDLEPSVVIPSDVSTVFTTQRGTTLKSGEATVSTIEHLLSALSALSIEDAEISVYGPEIPILDGSASFYIKELLKDGVLSEEESAKDIFIVQESFSYIDEETGSEYAIYPSDNAEYTVVLEFSDETLGDMVARMTDKAQFASSIADARTFVFLSDVEPLFDKGLIKGGDLDNALVIIDKKLSDSEIDLLRKKLNKPNASIEAGVISSTPMRSSNEPARHKLLDLIGDLSLTGRDIQAKIIATKPGHTSNVKLAKILKAKYLEQRKNIGKPVYDPNVLPIMDVEKIKTMLPHRYPFLLVDKVIELTPEYIVGVKNITFNEGYFQGHFPGNPVFPGVLQMEALAQTGGLFALSLVGDGGEWDTYFLKMDNVKFKVMVKPGDTLILKMQLMSPIRRGIVQMMGTAYVGNKLVSEGELTAQIVKRSDDK